VEQVVDRFTDGLGGPESGFGEKWFRLAALWG
jgi:hypothetical protein